MSSPFQDALREEPRAAAIRDLQCEREARTHRTRRTVRRGLVATVAAVISGLLAVLFQGSDPAAADIEIRIENGRVEVRITDLATTPDEVSEAMEAEGLSVAVTGVPVGPSNVGPLHGRAWRARRCGVSRHRGHSVGGCPRPV